jgi:predicted esterase/catechol 2,3-dioxygenase-like lactoylglutathione lyase family enzyme
MSSERIISGIHHITAITSSATENLQFYEKVLGLRLVKQTVNFDDPYTYHLYYGDEQGLPGTILTFFPWENLSPGRLGTGMVTAINFAIPRHSVDFWTRRLKDNHINTETTDRFGDPVITISDPHGLPLELTGTDMLHPTEHWKKSPIDESNAIRGFHSATATLTSFEESNALLEELMGMRLYAQTASRYRFKMGGPASPGQYYDIVVDPKSPPGRSGGGTVHHIAFRTENDATQAGWHSVLSTSGFAPTNIRDRQYFRSIYFHAPEGVLFEIATDTPGFTVDESADELGRSLRLPNQYEAMRAEIEKRLPPLRSKEYHHVFRTPQGRHNDDQTLVTLHGTGGNEHDLIPMAAEVSRTSAILSPRGNVLENGLPRFFKRLSNNIFDEADVIKRAHELSDFIVTAASKYGRNLKQMTALGYSNGANIAAAIILLRPEVFSRAVLIRPMMPLINAVQPDLQDKQILILRGNHDTVIPKESTKRLEEVFTAARAKITIVNINAGHEITDADLQTISNWLATQQDSEKQAIMSF